jgi:anti-sigma factor RsiW
VRVRNAKPRRKHSGRQGDLARSLNDQKTGVVPAKQQTGLSHRKDTTCKDEIALIADYLSSSLSAGTTTVFEQHLKGCPDCVAFLQTYKKTIEVTRDFLKMQALRDRPRSSNNETATRQNLDKQ